MVIDRENVCAMASYEAAACEWLCRIGLARELTGMRSSMCSRQGSRDLFEGRRVIEARWYTATPMLKALHERDALHELGIVL